jgi:predicted short-subunit dehydrogenase-like oxidoreductase (DUF2520 family)
MTESVAIVGRGRIGAGIGLALSAGGTAVTLLVRSPGSVGDLPVAVEPAAWREVIARCRVVLVATPDDAIPAAATALAELDVIGGGHSVLHCSGLLDQTALAPLTPSGAALGSLHPLMAVPDAVEAPTRLRGAFAGVEGDARAIEAAVRLSERCGMQPVRLTSAAKPAYHAAAAMVSNFTVAVYAAARRVAEAGGVAADMAAKIYLPLLRGTVDNLEHHDPVVALTGAIRRGDAETVRAHLGAVGAGDLRRLYLELGWATLTLARDAGLDPARVASIERVLRGD